MGTWLVDLLDRIFAAISALLFAQLPLFMQQYQQQLLGHVAELNIQVNAVSEVAAASGKTLPQYIHRFLVSGDSDFMQQGQLLHNMVERSLSLAQASQSLLHASAFEKPLLFVKYLNWDIASSTVRYFQPGLPFSTEGFLYGFVGILFGYATCLGMKRFLKFLYRLLCRKKVEMLTAKLS